jgi:protein-L-isoaspartate(D-aspartate) O-methyltransferase
VRDIAAVRRQYAERLRELANLRTTALVEAFATVSREHFLGSGPWQILRPPGFGPYATTPDADTIHLYQDVLVAIDASRLLNNGLPSSLALWLDALDLAPGASVVHVGCGVGYYTAVLAETVGAGGRVLGIEIDAALAERARAKLAYLPQVSVQQGDGFSLAGGARDAIFINAGATYVPPVWLDQLAPGGHLICPLTAPVADDNPNGIGWGLMLKVTRGADGYAARFISVVGIYPCLGARDPESGQRLREAFARSDSESVRSLRRDPHAEHETCWLHRPDVCLSKQP